MANLLIYATRADSDSIRKWINDSGEVAWIVKERELDLRYRWRAVRNLESVEQRTYAVWHLESGPLNIPSGNINVRDAVVQDPFAGWAQTLSYAGATSPWFGGNLPGPFSFSFAEDGCEAPGNLARSEFSWSGDRYRCIGKPAHPAARNWWRKLERFVKLSAIAIPWVEALSNRKIVPKAYVFPDAERQIHNGRARDINPRIPSRVSDAPMNSDHRRQGEA